MNSVLPCPTRRVWQGTLPTHFSRRILSANFLSGEVLAAGDETVDVSVMGVALQIPAGAGHKRGGTAVVVARPESIRVGEGELRATVKGSTFLGSYAEYELELGDGQENMLAVDGEWMSHGIHQPGDEIAWTLARERAYALPPAPTKD